MAFNDKVDMEQLKAESLPLDEPILELKPFLSSLKYAFIDTQ